MKKLFALPFVLILLLTGCSSIDQGYITSKDYSPSYMYYRQTCVSYNENGGCRQYIQQPIYVPENFRFNLEQGEKTGWVNVPEHEYSSYEVGDYYNQHPRRS